MKKDTYVFERYRVRSMITGKLTYRFRYKCVGNRETIFPSHPYNSRQAREKGIALIKRTVVTAQVVDA